MTTGGFSVRILSDAFDAGGRLGVALKIERTQGPSARPDPLSECGAAAVLMTLRSARNRTSLLCKPLCLSGFTAVRDTGFEPVTPTVSRERFTEREAFSPPLTATKKLLHSARTAILGLCLGWPRRVPIS